MKVSKVVLIVVALHVLVIGGIFVFEGCSRAKAPEVAAAGPADETGTNSAALPTDPLAQTVPPAATVPSNLMPVAPVAPLTPVAPAPVARTYVVKKGETLAKIAKAEHVKASELASANKLTKTTALKVGQKLTIPVKAEASVTAVASATPAPAAPAATATAPAVSGSSYTVKSGDSLWKIAKANNVSVAALKQANNLTSDSLKVNQKLTIPSSATTATATATPAAAASATELQPGLHADNSPTTHIVDIGESLGSIAKKYNVSVSDLIKANNLSDGKRVSVSQKLVIPSASAPTPVTTATPAIAAPIVSTLN